MAYVEGQSARSAYAVSDALDELIPEEHVCRVIEAFVNRLDMGDWGLSVPRRGVPATIRGIY